MKSFLLSIYILISFLCKAQIDTVVMNDGRQILCKVRSSNYNFIGVTLDSTEYLISKKYIHHYVLTSSQQPSLLIKNMNYEHSLNDPKYTGKGHGLDPLKYRDPMAVAGNSLVAMGFLWIISSVVVGSGVGLKSTPVIYTGATIGGISVIPLIIAGSKLVQSANRDPRYRFIK